MLDGWEHREPTDKPPLIVFDAVSKVYGAESTRVIALDRVHLEISSGELVAIVGPSGSGKSTTMNILGCLATPTSGAYRLKGNDVGQLTKDQRALLRRQYLGFIFQGFNLLERTTALENVELPLVYRGFSKQVRRDAAAEALELVGLADRAGHTPSELSGGQQQRVAIARAIVSQPDIILADEPTGNLDTNRSAEIIALLTKLNIEKGITVVIVTHDPNVAAKARRVIRFADGRIAGDSDSRMPPRAGRD